ncbi:sulfate/molybdate ABC transporter ATP-binding protein [Campylobacter ureolyticus]|uniref:Molybdenum ABC transporter ModABC, ATP-binding protein n=1 Tax=Campylobacter ureolyticus TaxID=827 RepID=A0AAE7E8Q3_9BACT|nr:ATP-binding cassette domain-containing protein [Campylobacter ureolyticus]MCR8684937.1 ATP-binding cassette domain-containing protein [Campylobacter ureolyticus]QKF83709.1 molybdenum ABC transporter ModABC, ATP-binding protein [Campylobacter ureolyticus]QQY36135.1 ATP-binding cassette domain-containing protein [Campylobacter ureolyticus]SUX24958.1 RNA pseudouridine synthase [Campylobacter ureolyticus]
MIEFSLKKELFGVNENMELNVKISFKSGSFISLSGESGSGKTTILRCLAGLEKANGFIKVDDEIWQDEKIFLSPQKRRIGFVFQDYALFENLSVKDNFLFVEKDINHCNKLLDMLGLMSLKDRYPTNLSGGQKQRVALGRAMMRKPKLLLLDEPLSALDPHLRARLQDEISKIQDMFKTTTILVSHDPNEIYKLANYMFVLKNGKIVKKGTPKEILLKTNGSQKFAFSGTLLNLEKIDTIFVATVSVGQQITEVALASDLGLRIGDEVTISSKAFNLNISKILEKENKDIL